VFYLFNALKINQLHPKIVKMYGKSCYASGMRMKCDGKVDFVIIVSFNKPRESLDCYKNRWPVETLSKALKSIVFNAQAKKRAALKPISDHP